MTTANSKVFFLASPDLSAHFRYRTLGQKRIGAGNRYWFILSPEVQSSTFRLRLSGADKLKLEL